MTCTARAVKWLLPTYSVQAVTSDPADLRQPATTLDVSVDVQRLWRSLDVLGQCFGHRALLASQAEDRQPVCLDCGGVTARFGGTLYRCTERYVPTRPLPHSWLKLPAYIGHRSDPAAAIRLPARQPDAPGVAGHRHPHRGHLPLAGCGARRGSPRRRARGSPTSRRRSPTSPARCDRSRSRATTRGTHRSTAAAGTGRTSRFADLICESDRPPFALGSPAMQPRLLATDVGLGDLDHASQPVAARGHQRGAQPGAASPTRSGTSRSPASA